MLAPFSTTLLNENKKKAQKKMGFATRNEAVAPLQQAEQIGGHKTMALFSQRRARTVDDDWTKSYNASKI